VNAKGFPSEDDLALYRDLRAARRYEEARRAIGGALAALAHEEGEGARHLARRFYALLAQIEDDYGNHAEAADAYSHAAQAMSGGDSKWLRALSHERRYRSADRLEPHARIALRAELRHGVDRDVEEMRDDAGSLVPVLWLRSRLLTGAHPDDRPTPEQLERAFVDLDRALRLAPESGRLQVTKARLVRVAASYGDDLVAKVHEARAELAAMPDVKALEVTPHESSSTAFDYERAQLELVGRNLEEAAALFEAVIAETSPTHQAAQVWRLYCRRVTGAATDEQLLHEIDDLLTDAADGLPPPIIQKDLRAELLSERATLLERSYPARALKDYQAVRQQRPRMPFAMRGTLRCLYMSQQEDDALALAGRLLEQEQNGVGEERLTADVLAEISQLFLYEREYERAIELLDRAIALRPTYSYAYAEKVRALRTQGRVKESMRFARRTLEGRRGKLSTPTGIQVELGHSLLALSRPNSALSQFMQAEDDASSYISERARKGSVQALLWKRDLGAARQVLDRSSEAIRSGTSAGWYYGALGDYPRALECFSSDTSVSAAIGKARVTRLLGRPSQALRELRATAEQLPRGLRLDLLPEMGWAALESGDYERARELFEEVLLKDPKSQSAHRGRITAARKNVEQLPKCVAAALDAAGSDRRAVGAVLTDAGAAHLAAGDRETAQSFFTQANESSGGTSQRLIQGRALIGARDLPGAESVVEEAAALAAASVVTRVDTVEILQQIQSLVLDAKESGVESLDEELGFELNELDTTPASQAVADEVRTLWKEMGEKLSFHTTQTAVESLIVDAKAAQAQQARASRPPADPDVLLLVGACRLSYRAPQAAIDHFSQAGQICGEHTVPSSLGRSIALLEANELSSARRRLEVLTQQKVSSMRANELLAWAKLASVQQGPPRVGWIKSRVQARLPGMAASTGTELDSTRDEIVQLCRSVISEEPKRGEAYACLAALALHERRIQDAVAHLEQAVSALPDDAYPIREKAAVLLRMGSYEDARKCVSEALAREPFDARAHLTEGLIALEQEQTLEAISSLRQAHALDAADPFAPVALSTALEAAGRRSEANAVLTQALNTASHGGYMQILLARARLQHSTAKTQSDMPPEAHLSWALDDATRATQLAGTANDRAEGHYHRGVILLTLGRPRAAARALRGAVGQDPTNGRARYALAAVNEIGAGDAETRLLNRAAYTVIAASALVLLLIIIQAIRLAVTEPVSKFQWTPMVWYALLAIGAIAGAGVLPRVAGVKFKQIEITIAPRPATPEAPAPTLDFGRLPLATLWGPSAYRTTDVVPDLAGLPEWA
jgi:tetratricopeptide (TPR) repeat protein